MLTVDWGRQITLPVFQFHITKHFVLLNIAFQQRGESTLFSLIFRRETDILLISNSQAGTEGVLDFHINVVAQVCLLNVSEKKYTYSIEEGKKKTGREGKGGPADQRRPVADRGLDGAVWSGLSVSLLYAVHSAAGL